MSNIVLDNGEERPGEVPVDNNEMIAEDEKSPVAEEVSNIVLANNDAGEVPVDNTNGEESSVDPLDNIILMVAVTGSPVQNEEVAIEIPSFSQQGSSFE